MWTIFLEIFELIVTCQWNVKRLIDLSFVKLFLGLLSRSLSQSDCENSLI